MTSQEILNDIIQALVDQDKAKVFDLVKQGLSSGMDPLEIVNGGLVRGLQKIGDLFAEEVIFLPELVFSGQVVTDVMIELKSKLADDSSIANKGRFIIATVKGDVHDIGKNLVALILGAAGYDVIDIGKDVSVDSIIEKINELEPDILGLSALLSTTMPAQKDVVQAIEEAGLREKVKIMIGGAPVTRAWAEQIGADGYAENASAAVEEANRLMDNG
jgi:corrinoid protein of di/trimethylamine methyltransferase